MLLAISSIGRPVGCSGRAAGGGSSPGTASSRSQLMAAGERSSRRSISALLTLEGEHGQDAERDAAVHLLTVSLPPTPTTRMPDENAG